MPSFHEMFLKSKGQPVEYNGHLIRMSDLIPITDGQHIRIVFESANSDWRQGVYLSTDGSFEVNGQNVRKAVVLWKDTAPREVLLQVQTKQGAFRVKNVWDVGDGVMHSGHNGAAMISEEASSSRRYKCNDGRADDDFDDLIFTIELL
jgi:hypothetical protein